MVGDLYNIQIMLDDYCCVTSIDQLVDDAQQLANIFEMESRCGLIEDVERAARVVLAEFCRQLYALALSAR